MRNWLEINCIETEGKILLNLDNVESIGESTHKPGHAAICLVGYQDIIHCKESYDDIRRKLE